MRVSHVLTVAAAYAAATILAIFAAFLAALAIESRSASVVTSRLLNDGITWAAVEADGLKLYIRGTAPNEAARFRAVNLAGAEIDASRVRDELEVAPVRAIEAPRFSVEMLRNGDGLQLIGLLPAGGDGTDPVAALTEEAQKLASGLQVSDMLETAAFPPPEGWDRALGFGLTALRMLPRSKISVAADAVAITAISDSESEKRRLESDLARQKPDGLAVRIDISAPRPVLTPFTLRFLKDEGGARFDACSADTDKARDRILAAAIEAGMEGKVPCTIGLGVPSPSWAAAAEAGIRAVAQMGAGSFTMSDADLTLQATVDTPQATFDRAVGELRAALPDVFSLTATLPPKPSATQEGPAEFTATLAETGRVELRGRVTDDLLQKAVDSYARARFGADTVYTATRLDEQLPDGWPVRVLAGLESLAQLAHGAIVVRADTVEVAGVTGSVDGRARITQILSTKLGQGQSFKVDVTYDKRLDPLAGLPTPQECQAEIVAAMARQKITFAPGSTEIDAGAGPTLDAMAETLKRCPDVRFEIGGHTDSQGSEDGNRAISQARAEAVKIALQGRRAPVGALTAVGYGEARPVADNATEDGREANRRIEFTLLDPPAPPPAPAAEAAAEPAAATGAEPAAPTAPAAGPATNGDGPDFSADDSPSVAPTEKTQRPKTRPQDP